MHSINYDILNYPIHPVSCYAMQRHEPGSPDFLHMTLR